ncbi:MAG: hypothetical protein K6B68_02720 [Eubacterium sp.]|nr:hypothetical protein [Eubacterium sp.]
MSKKRKLTVSGKVTKALAFVMAAILMIGATLGLTKGKGSTVNAAYTTPRLMVTGCDIKGNVVKAGDEFEMVLHLKNEATSTKLTNIKLKLSCDDNLIVPSSGSDSIYIDELAKEEETDVSVKMKTKTDLEQKNYIVNVAYAYENSWGESFDDSASVTVPVIQDSKIGISEIKLSKAEVTEGGKTSLSFKVNNMGLDKLRNVSVEFSGDTIEEITYFVGTIESGESGSVDMTITPDKVGNDDIHITVTYEDVLGNSKTMEETVGLVVNEEVVEEAAVEPETSAAKLPVVPIAGVAAIFVIVMIIVSAVKKRNLKKYE